MDQDEWSMQPASPSAALAAWLLTTAPSEELKHLDADGLSGDSTHAQHRSGADSQLSDVTSRSESPQSNRRSPSDTVDDVDHGNLLDQRRGARPAANAAVLGTSDDRHARNPDRDRSRRHSPARELQPAATPDMSAAMGGGEAAISPYPLSPDMPCLFHSSFIMSNHRHNRRGRTEQLSHYECSEHSSSPKRHRSAEPLASLDGEEFQPTPVSRGGNAAFGGITHLARTSFPAPVFSFGGASDQTRSQTSKLTCASLIGGGDVSTGAAAGGCSGGEEGVAVAEAAAATDVEVSSSIHSDTHGRTDQRATATQMSGSASNNGRRMVRATRGSAVRPAWSRMLQPKSSDATAPKMSTSAAVAQQITAAMADCSIVGHKRSRWLRSTAEETVEGGAATAAATGSSIAGRGGGAAAAGSTSAPAKLRRSPALRSQESPRSPGGIMLPALDKLRLSGEAPKPRKKERWLP